MFADFSSPAGLITILTLAIGILAAGEILLPVTQQADKKKQSIAWHRAILKAPGMEIDLRVKVGVSNYHKVIFSLWRSLLFFMVFLTIMWLLLKLLPDSIVTVLNDIFLGFVIIGVGLSLALIIAIASAAKVLYEKRMVPMPEPIANGCPLLPTINSNERANLLQENGSIPLVDCKSVSNCIWRTGDNQVCVARKVASDLHSVSQ